MGHDIREEVRERYGRIAEESGSCCSDTCCGAETTDKGASNSLAMGYSGGELASIPGDADLGVGCGNPLALAEIKEGDTVLDLGSGAGIDCFLAAARVGETGRVIGVDMTPEMLVRARRNATHGGYENVEFRQGHIEDLPVEDNAIDLITSNCVINLSPDKRAVFAEAFRVLRPGGVLTVSDIVVTGELPQAIRQSVSAYVGCIAGALKRDDYLQAVTDAGFDKVEVVGESAYAIDALLENPDIKQAIEAEGLSDEQARSAAASVVSLKVHATKPQQN